MKGIIIPARSAATRFPRKHLHRLGDTTVIGMLIRRAREVGEPVVVATTWYPSDWELREEVEAHGAIAWPGHPTDLNDRYLSACEHLHIDQYLDISGDCPFFDQAQARRIWAALGADGYDTYTEEQAYSPNDTGVAGRARSYLVKWRDLIVEVSAERREQYWTAVKPPELNTLILPYHGDRTRTPIKLSIDWPMDLAIANVIIDVLGGPPQTREDLELVWSRVTSLSWEETP